MSLIQGKFVRRAKRICSCKRKRKPEKAQIGKLINIKIVSSDIYTWKYIVLGTSIPSMHSEPWCAKAVHAVAASCWVGESNDLV